MAGALGFKPKKPRIEVDEDTLTGQDLVNYIAALPGSTGGNTVPQGFEMMEAIEGAQRSDG